MQNMDKIGAHKKSKFCIFINNQTTDLLDNSQDSKTSWIWAIFHPTIGFIFQHLTFYVEEATLQPGLWIHQGEGMHSKAILTSQTHKLYT